MRYDPSTGTLSIETAGPNVTLEELGSGVAFTRVDDDEERLALFVATDEADVLLKMVNYIFSKVTISASSRAALERIKPRLEALLAAPGDS